MDIFDLFAKISLDSSEYETQLSGAQKKTNDFGSKLGAGLKTAGKIGGVALVGAGTAIAGVTKGFIDASSELAEYGDEIDKNSQKIGFSAEAYQEWDFVLAHAGTSMNDASIGIKTMSNKVGEALEGNESAIASFEALGISIEDLQTMSREETFGAMIEGFQNMEDSTYRASLANEMFGKSGQSLTPIFNQTSEETQGLIDMVNELGGVLGDDTVSASADFVDSLFEMQTKMDGMKNSVMADFLPSMVSVMDGLTAIFSGDEGGADMVNDAIENISKTIEDKMPQILTLIGKIMPLVSKVITSSLPMVVESAGKILISLVSGISQSLPTLMPAVISVITSLVNDLIILAPQLIESAIVIIQSLSSGLSESLPQLIPSVISMILTIIETLSENLDILLDSGIQLLLAVADGIISAIPELIERAPIIITKLVMGLISHVPMLISCALQLIVALGTGLVQAIPSLLASVPQVMEALVAGVEGFLESFVGAGKNLIEGLWNGISSKTDWIVEKVKGFGESVLSGLKSFFGIESPSKVMRDQVGKFLAEGVAVGFEEGDAVGEIEDSLNSAMRDMDIDTFGIDTEVRNIGTASAFGGTASSIESLERSISALALQLESDGNDIIIPINIGNEKIDTLIINAKKRNLIKSGGLGYGY